MASRFDQRGIYQQTHFPKRVISKFPKSFNCESKQVLIFPGYVIKHNSSKKSKKQNERKFPLHQKMTKRKHWKGLPLQSEYYEVSLIVQLK